jgi:hypothetical protein
MLFGLQSMLAMVKSPIGRWVMLGLRAVLAPNCLSAAALSTLLLAAPALAQPASTQSPSTSPSTQVPSTAAPTATTAPKLTSNGLNPYPEVVIERLLSSCKDNARSFSLDLPLDRTVGKSALQIVQKPIERISEQAKQAETEVEQQVQERKQQLADLLSDKAAADAQIKQLQDAIQAKQIPEGQLPQVKELLKDLQEIKANPALLNRKADDSRQKLLAEIRNQKTIQTNILQQCACQVEAIQKRYPVTAFYQNAIAELTGDSREVSDTWNKAKATCQKRQ